MKKIVVGVDQAAGLHPDNVMVTALCGVLRGAGTSIIKPLVRSVSLSNHSKVSPYSFFSKSICECCELLI